MKLGYVILYVPDVRASLSFYEHAFGLARRFVDDGGHYGELDTGATALAFAAESMPAFAFARNRRDAVPAGAEVAFVTDDVPARYEQALRAGAEPVLAPTKKPWGQLVSYVRDRDGFLVEICSPVGT